MVTSGGFVRLPQEPTNFSYLILLETPELQFWGLRTPVPLQHFGERKPLSQGTMWLKSMGKATRGVFAPSRRCAWHPDLENKQHITKGAPSALVCFVAERRAAPRRTLPPRLSTSPGASCDRGRHPRPKHPNLWSTGRPETRERGMCQKTNRGSPNCCGTLNKKKNLAILAPKIHSQRVRGSLDSLGRPSVPDVLPEAVRTL